MPWGPTRPVENTACCTPEVRENFWIRLFPVSATKTLVAVDHHALRVIELSIAAPVGAAGNTEKVSVGGS